MSNAHTVYQMHTNNTHWNTNVHTVCTYVQYTLEHKCTHSMYIHTIHTGTQTHTLYVQYCTIHTGTQTYTHSMYIQYTLEHKCTHWACKTHTHHFTLSDELTSIKLSLQQSQNYHKWPSSNTKCCNRVERYKEILGHTKPPANSNEWSIQYETMCKICRYWEVYIICIRIPLRTPTKNKIKYVHQWMYYIWNRPDILELWQKHCKRNLCTLNTQLGSSLQTL